MRYSVLCLLAAAVGLAVVEPRDSSHPARADETLMLAQARGGGYGRGGRGGPPGGMPGSARSRYGHPGGPSRGRPGGRQGGYHGGHYPYPGGTYGYGYVYPYPPDWPYYGDYYWYPPPLYLPAETIYGPEAVKRFMGVSPTTPVPRAYRAPADRAIRAPVDDPAPLAPGDAEPDEPEIPKSHPAAVARAWRLIGLGDANFAEQDFQRAATRYREAVQAAPDLGEAHFRRGYAYMAQGRYELAVQALKRGLKVRPDWPASDFTADELYGGANLAKQAHLDALAMAAEDDPNNADLLFLVGVRLYFDGQRARSAPFFQRAAALTDDDAHLRPFLNHLAQGARR